MNDKAVITSKTEDDEGKTNFPIYRSFCDFN